VGVRRKPRHPDQPLVWDRRRVIRFRANRVVCALLDAAAARGFGLNELWQLGLPEEHMSQFYQLIGYSVSGCPFSTERHRRKARAMGRARGRRS
jgi:hypothetical protein